MGMRDVTFEELLAILRSPAELVANTAAENRDHNDTDHADIRGSRGAPATHKNTLTLLAAIDAVIAILIAEGLTLLH
jgi:hypothetical protein